MPTSSVNRLPFSAASSSDSISLRALVDGEAIGEAPRAGGVTRAATVVSGGVDVLATAVGSASALSGKNSSAGDMAATCTPDRAEGEGLALRPKSLPDARRDRLDLTTQLGAAGQDDDGGERPDRDARDHDHRERPGAETAGRSRRVRAPRGRARRPGAASTSS